MEEDEKQADQGSAETSILIADDDETVVHTLEHWLCEHDDWKVKTVTTGGDAVKALNEDVDVFLCDRKMPELSGHQVIERFEAGGYDIPVIIISAYDPDSYLNEEYVDTYLNKPIARDELIEAIEEQLEN